MQDPRQPPRRAVPVDRVRGHDPADPSWRADALAASRHSRLIDELRQPLDDQDPGRAEEICAAVARAALRDFAPALVLMPAADRRRGQALAAYALTLFDFARQSGLEGERLAQINRWEFNLELALAGQPPGQPVFVRMAQQEAAGGWPRQALERVAAAARARVTRRRPATAEQLEARCTDLAAALAHALTGEPASDELARWGGALLRLRGLQTLGEGLRRRAAPLPTNELPDDREGLAAGRLDEAVRAECRRLRPLLEDPRAAAELPRRLRRSAAYLRLAGLRLLRRIEWLGAETARRPPGLGPGARIGCVLRSMIRG